MNFNDFPLKVELSQGLHVYERKTGKSAHMLIEQLISEFLIKEGYLNIAIENLVNYPEKLLHIDEEISVDEDCEEMDSSDGEYVFSTKNQNGKIRLFYNDLDFSSHDPEHIEKIKSQLNKCDFSELESLSVNNCNIPIRRYKSFLYSKLELSDLIPETPQLKNSFIHLVKQYGTYRVMKNGSNFGSHKTLEKAKEVRDFMIAKNWDKKYSSKEKNLKGKAYTQWLYSVMEQEGK